MLPEGLAENETDVTGRSIPAVDTEAGFAGDEGGWFLGLYRRIMMRPKIHKIRKKIHFRLPVLA